MTNEPDLQAAPALAAVSTTSSILFRTATGFLVWGAVATISCLLTQQYPIMYRNVHVPPTSLLDWFALSILAIWAIGSLPLILKAFTASMGDGLLFAALFTGYFVYISLLGWVGVLLQFLLSVLRDWAPFILSLLDVDKTTAQSLLDWEPTLHSLLDRWAYIHSAWSILTTLAIVIYLYRMFFWRYYRLIFRRWDPFAEPGEKRE